MTHELRAIFLKAISNQKSDKKSVLATVVFLEGSSYRKPGVRMLLSEDGQMTGAISGGCVEKEVYKKSLTVFESGTPQVITYDGRYRLGCEGLIYILLEPLFISTVLQDKFELFFKHRSTIEIHSFYLKQECSNEKFGSIIYFEDGTRFPFSKSSRHETGNSIDVFKQAIKPNYKLLLIGGEHDALKLCEMGSLLGWEVEVVTKLSETKTKDEFKGAVSVEASSAQAYEFQVDDQTAVVLMNHNYANDLKYLIKLSAIKLPYIGIVGSTSRREKILDDIINFTTDIDDNFFNSIHSPAGINIGAITPEEIALSILSEILTVFRKKETVRLNRINASISKCVK